jgi:hypothetical protein
LPARPSTTSTSLGTSPSPTSLDDLEAWDV